MERKIKELDPNLGRIPKHQAAPPPPKQSQSQDKNQLLEDIKTKIFSRVNLSDTFEIDGIFYTLKIVDLKELSKVNSKIIKEFNLRELPEYDPKKGVIEQGEKLNPEVLVAFAACVLTKAITHINSFSVEEIFGDTSMYPSVESGLEQFTNCITTPVVDLFTKYINLRQRDTATELELKNS